MAKTTMVIIAAVVMVLINGIAANTLVVGGDEGWKVPESKNFYISWAAKQIFTVGDTLVFDFETGSHTVAIVTIKEANELCNSKLDMKAEVVDDGLYRSTLTSYQKHIMFSAFNFPTGFHTVAIVTLKKAYDECVIELDMDAVEIEEGPFERNLTIAGQFYFFCTIGSHCDNGLKFAANVTSL